MVILLGLAAGLIYGWLIHPVDYRNTTPATLRADYQTDFVLMVAEIYASEKNPTLAAGQLAYLGSESPARYVQQAIVNAESFHYDRQDINLMAALMQAVQTIPTTEATP